MIRSLFFQSFGKFTQKHFELAEVTVVLGENEAGKTTFFDGLFQALCSPSETKKAGKLLKSRYGQSRSVSLTYTNNNGVKTIPEDVFLNLYAIRAGDLNMEWNPGNDWVEKLKSQLFHGGIDPKVLAEEFEKRSSDKKNFVHNKEIEAARLKKEAAKIQLEKLNRERQTLFEKEKLLLELESALRQSQTEMFSINKHIDNLEQSLAFEDRILQRHKLESQIAKIVNLEKLRAEAEKLRHISQSSRDEWEILNQDYQKSLTAVNSSKIKCEFHHESLMNAKTEALKLNSELQNSEKEAVAAKILMAEIQTTILKKEKGNRPLLYGFSLALIFFGMGLFSLYFLKHSAAILTLTISVLLGLASGAIGYRFNRLSKNKKSKLDLARWNQDWQQARPSQDFKAIETTEAFLIILQQVQSESEIQKRQASALNEKLSELESRYSDLLKTNTQFEKEMLDIKQQEKQLLQSLGVQSGDELLLKISKAHSLRTQIVNAEGEVQKISAQQSPNELMRDINRKLNQMDEEGISSQGLDEASLQRLKLEYKEFKSQKESLNQKERIQVTQASQLSGEVGNSSGKLASEIVAAEDLIKLYHTEIETKELEKKAAVMAGEIFKNMGDGASYLWSSVATQIEKILAPIMPHSRTLELVGLSTDQLQYQDALGVKRSLDHLSTGTRDLVVLAARLALAMISKSEPAVLVLDEPFLSFDHNRETGAIHLLKNFQECTGCQIVLLTKERQLLQKMQLAFSNLALITLP